MFDEPSSVRIMDFYQIKSIKTVITWILQPWYEMFVTFTENRMIAPPLPFPRVFFVFVCLLLFFFFSLQLYPTNVVKSCIYIIHVKCRQLAVKPHLIWSEFYWLYISVYSRNPTCQVKVTSAQWYCNFFRQLFWWFTTRFTDYSNALRRAFSFSHEPTKYIDS